MESGKRKRGKRGRDTKSSSQKNKKKKTQSSIFEQPQPSSSQGGGGNLQKPKSTKSSFLEKMKARLSGGHFKMINEKLYTYSGDEALDYFKQDPYLFNVYHTGYQEQMSHWPEQPFNIIIKWIKERKPSLVVADFGCGDARLAKNVKNKVFSFDLVASDPSVVACDMSKDFSNKMFLLFFFKKKENQSSVETEIEWPELKPCLYKRR